MKYYIQVLKKYAVFKGRARRAEYWYFILFSSIISFLLGFLEGLLGINPDSNESVLGTIYFLVILIPTIAAAVRRMHDVNKSGWFILVPIYNLILGVREGTKGDNKYGPDPKENDKTGNEYGFGDNAVENNQALTKDKNDYIDLGHGENWFDEYRHQGKPTLAKFFHLKKEDQISIKAKIYKIGYYTVENKKLWAVIAKYTDDRGKEFTFYCPEWEYDPIKYYTPGDTLTMYVDRDDYNKYDMPIY